MGSSGGGGDYTAPDRPAPPANLIQPQGSNVPFVPHYINFLGDTNTPSTGLTPDMLAQIDAMNGPPGPPPSANGAYDAQIADLRNQLAAMQAAQNKKPQPIYGRGGGEGG
ncbi:MAG TPA: hypothetical protein VL172_08140, partial [Kofleriaceae bacterium]|nr:hypothetical protein [Kofleriaceae bacterium]